MRFEFTVRVGEDDHDVAVGTPRPLRLHEVWPRLLAVLGAPGHLQPQLDPRTLLGSRPLATGSVLATGAPSPPREPAAGLSVHVIGGRDAGRCLPLAPGVVHIGRDPHCGLVLSGERVSRHHATLRSDPTGVSLRDCPSTNGTVVEAVPVGSATVALPIDAVARLGDTLLCVRDRDEPALPVAPGGACRYVTPVSSVPEPAPPVLDLATGPPRARPRPTQWLAAVLPAVAGAGLAWLTHSATFLLFALLSPVMLLGTSFGERLTGRRSRRRGEAERSARRVADQQAVAAALRSETAARRSRHPDPGLVHRAASVPTTRLWQRRLGDDDTLVLRIGSTDTASRTAVRRDGVTAPAGQLFAVPLTVDLRGGPVGFAGPRDALDGLARWLVAQLAVLHPPTAVTLALVIAESTGAERWAWARWLPHLGDRVARSASERDELVDRLVSAAAQDPGRHVVVVVDRSVADRAGRLADLLGAEPRTSVTALVFADATTDLPSWCAHIVDLWQPVSGAVVDRVGPDWADQVARALAPLAEARRDGSGPPASCNLLDVLDLDGPTVEEIRTRWGSSCGRAATVLGRTADGLLELDLDRDGPHALVAGTTGSGKSELLRTLVLGLALQSPPDELTFVLVDYKGGAAFADCASLPHTVGTVTDLDPHLTRRALRSLEAELRHRERLLAAAGAGALDAYRRTGGPALPRLVIVVDEFAELADTQPDFLHGLISVARRGRSLGVHLVLATQRPGVAVTPEIRANTACRIALRVIEAAESTDVLGVPDAAALPARRPGRALLAADGTTVEFQAAGLDAVARTPRTGLVVERLGPWRTAAATVHDPGAPGRVGSVVDALCQAAEKAGTPRPRRPWLDPLPDVVEPTSLTPSGPGRVPFALLDLPAEQRQDTLELDLRTPSSWLVVGGPRSGRTNALLGAALAAAESAAADELEIYVIDAAGELATALRTVPHVATCLGPDELGSAAVLVRALARRAPPTVHTLVIIDRAEQVLVPDEADPGRDGAADLAGLLAGHRATVLVAGSRALLTARVAGAFEHRLLLALTERADYAFTGVASRDVPATMPPGRAVRVADGAELQIARRDDRQAAVEALRAGRAGVGSSTAVRIRPLPRAVGRLSLPAHPTMLRLGCGGDGAVPVHVDPLAGPCRWLVAGPSRSGRTTALLTLLAEAGRVGVPVLVVAPARSPLQGRGRDLGLPVLDPTAGDPPAAATSGTPERPTLVLVDDVEALAGTETDDVLAAWARGGAPTSFVVAGRTDELAAAYRGLAAEVRRARSGLLLRPGPLDGELLDVRLARGPEVPPGRGLLVGGAGCFAGGAPVTDTGPFPVQVAQP